MDTMTYLSKIWLKYLDGKATIAEVVAEYEKNGFDACQDIPSNYHWKELYDHLGPDTKVILTVRDNTDRWWNSYVNFFTQETELKFSNAFLYNEFHDFLGIIKFFENCKSVVDAVETSIMVISLTL